MTHTVEAIYEHGVLRPLEPLPLQEREHVSITVNAPRSEPRRAYRDLAYLEQVRKEVEAMGQIPSLEEVREMSSGDSSSWSDFIVAEREDRF